MSPVPARSDKSAVTEAVREVHRRGVQAAAVGDWHGTARPAGRGGAGRGDALTRNAAPSLSTSPASPHGTHYTDTSGREDPPRALRAAHRPTAPSPEHPSPASHAPPHGAHPGPPLATEHGRRPPQEGRLQGCTSEASASVLRQLSAPSPAVTGGRRIQSGSPVL